jgi:hypothetical protein
MLSADTTARLKAMMGSFTQPQLLNAVAAGAGGGGGRSVTMGDVSFQIYAQPGQSPQDIAAAVRGELTELLRSMAN